MAASVTWPGARELREALAPESFLARARAAPPGSLKFERGILSHPEWPPPPEEVGAAFLVDVEEAQLPGAMDGYMFVDGACYPHVIPDLARAGWAAVQHNLVGSSRVIYGPVWPPPPQTPQAAEWVAWAVAHQVACGPSKVYPDCLNVTRAHDRPLQAKLWHANRFGVITRSTLSSATQELALSKGVSRSRPISAYLVVCRASSGNAP